MKGLPANDDYSFMLPNKYHWKDNIILPEVAAYVEAEVSRRDNFALHHSVHHGLSSQAAAFNLIGPLIVRDDLAPLLTALSDNGVPIPDEPITASLEYEDRAVFNENQPQPTSIDLVLAGRSSRPFLFIECKLVEDGFGMCSQPGKGLCDKLNPAQDFSLCILQREHQRRYWDVLDRHGFNVAHLRENPTCLLAKHYQFFREILFALEYNGDFVLLYDARNPVWWDSRNAEMPYLLGLVPEALRPRVHSITIQDVVAAVRASGRHEWIGEFERKYGLAS